MRRLLLLALLVSVASGCGKSGGQSTSSAREALASEMTQNVPRWKAQEHLPARAYAGARLFASSGCTTCHTYAGSGARNLGAPDLTAIGNRQLGVRFQIRHLKCPSCVNPGSPMPPFASLGPARLRQLAVFLEASKGTH
jgi:mono/diheme cytochrome c family protein